MAFYPDFRVRFNTLNLSCRLNFFNPLFCMNHLASIVVSRMSVTSRLNIVESERPKFAREQAASQNQSFQEYLCTALFLYLNHAESLLALRLSCFVIVFLSRVNAQQWPPRKDQALHSIGVFVHFFLLFFFANLPFTVERYRCLCVMVCCELQAADEKI